MSFSSRLKERREFLGMSRSELAKALNVTPSAIGNYENGVSSPKEEILYKIFSVLKVEPNYLWQDEMSANSIQFLVSYPEQEHIKKYRTLDEYGKDAVNAILDCEYNRCTQQSTDETSEPSKVIYLAHSELKASAGFGWNLDEQQMEKWKVLLNDITRKADFCVDVSGDSMEPKFHDGDIILVRSQPSVELGEIGLYVFDGCGYVKRQGDEKIESINPQYPDIEPTESSDIDCKGLILGILDPEWIIEK